MPSEPQRKLAIMFTDMAGYTTLMQEDEPILCKKLGTAAQEE